MKNRNQTVSDRIRKWNIPEWMEDIINDTDFNNIADLYDFENEDALIDHMEREYGHWYAVMMDVEDNDWGIGSYDLDEAISMARGMDAEYIAVIEMGNDPICVDEIRDFGAVACKG